MTRQRLGGFIAGVSLLVAAPAWAQAPTTSGEFTVEPPTLLSLGFDWKISGDDNRNAHVDDRWILRPRPGPRRVRIRAAHSALWASVTEAWLG